MEDYLAQERPKHVEGSPSLEILEETVCGLLEYFDKSLGRILLYRYVLRAFTRDRILTNALQIRAQTIQQVPPAVGIGR